MIGPIDTRNIAYLTQHNIHTDDTALTEAMVMFKAEHVDNQRAADIHLQIKWTILK